MSHLRWLMLASHVPASGQGGGMIRYTVEMARALHQSDDVELSVVAAPSAKSFFVDGLGLPAARVHRLPTSITMGQAVVERMALGSIVTLDGFDVVHGTKHLLPRSASGTTVLTVHDMLMLDRRYDFGVAKRSLLPGPYLRSIHQATVLACVSEATRQRLLSYAPAVRSRAKVVPLALSSALLSAPSTEVRALIDRPFALVVGDPSPRKNIAHVTGLWSEVVAAIPGATLALVGPPGWGRLGDDPTLDVLEEQGAVLRLGHLSDAELRWSYEHAAVTLCPSLLEGFGLPALEALSFGSPLITSEDPALAEASAGRATRVPLHDRRQWIDAIVEAFRQPSGLRSVSGPAVRDWAQVARQTVDTVRTRRRVPKAA